MKTPSDESPIDLLKAAGVWPLSAYHVHGLMMALLALCPVIVCAIFAEHSGRWDLFQRSGSITSAIGLFIASRRYIQFSLLELLQANDHLKTNKAELLYDIKGDRDPTEAPGGLAASPISARALAPTHARHGALLLR